MEMNKKDKLSMGVFALYLFTVTVSKKITPFFSFQPFANHVLVSGSKIEEL